MSHGLLPVTPHYVTSAPKAVVGERPNASGLVAEPVELGERQAHGSGPLMMQLLEPRVPGIMPTCSMRET
jgi:hypothetical protein